MSITTILITSIIISGLIHIRAHYYGPDKIKYLFKPLTTFLILILAGIAVTDTSLSYFYKQMIVAGLFFSIWGDVFLMMPSDRFIPGLISFLIAHIFYIIAFSINVPQNVPIYFIIPFLIYGVLIFRYLAPGIGKLRIPVMLYVIVIISMAFLAMNRLIIIPDQFNFYAFTGAILFLISDSILAIKKFRYDAKVSKVMLLLESEKYEENIKVTEKFKSARLLIMSTYYTAQVFIALSVH